MHKKIICLVIVLYSILLTSCSTKIDYYQSMGPKFNFQEFFQGDLIAHGMFKDRFGKVKKTFVVKMNAEWEGNICTLSEYFSYNDGTKSTRIWKIEKLSDNNFIGSADDVLGKAFGIVAGNALKWDYQLKLKVDEDEYKVDFDDWMYLVSDDVLLNQSYMNKWGINLGEVVLSIRKIK